MSGAEAGVNAEEGEADDAASRFGFDFWHCWLRLVALGLAWAFGLRFCFESGFLLWVLGSGGSGFCAGFGFCLWLLLWWVLSLVF